MERILRYADDAPEQDFVKNALVLDAIIRNLLVLGEAAKSVPKQVRNKFPEIEWRKISGLRDVLIHEYFGIKPAVIEDIVKNKLPVLKKQIRAILKKDFGR